MKKAIKILVGIGLVLAGLTWILSVLGIVTVNFFFPGWWTLFIIIPCFLNLFTDHDRTGSVFGILLGVVMLLCAQGILLWGDFWKFALAGLLILIGLKFIFGQSWVFGVDGAVRLDLRKAHIQPDALIRLDCSFCGVEILLPEGIVVKNATDAAFGGISDNRANKPATGEVTLYISGSISFGGVEIK